MPSSPRSALSPDSTNTPPDRSHFYAAALLLINLIFLLPGLIGNRDANSDVAVVGLQAAHLLRGEPGLFLWGTIYQGSVYPAIIAAFFSVAPHTGATIAFASACALLFCTYLTFAALKTAVSPATAFLLTLTSLAIVPYDIFFAFHPRSWCIVQICGAIYAISRSFKSEQSERWLFLTTLLMGSALYTDQYAGFFLPGLFVAALLSIFDRETAGPSSVPRKLLASLLGCLPGGVLLIMEISAKSHTAFTPVPPEYLGDQMHFLFRTCLSNLLGLLRTPIPTSSFGRLWHDSPLFIGLRWAVAAMLVAAMAASGICAFRRGEPAAVRRFGLLGWIVLLTTLALFLKFQVSVAIGSTRYLFPILTMMPFLLAPLAMRLGPQKFAAIVGPFVLCAWISAWTLQTDLSGELSPKSLAANRATEQGVIDDLRARGIAFALAPYWSSYNLTLLSNENPIFVPLSNNQDRYAPYRRNGLSARRFAVVMSPQSTDPSPGYVEGSLIRSGYGVQATEIPGYDVMIVTRPNR